MAGRSKEPPSVVVEVLPKGEDEPTEEEKASSEALADVDGPDDSELEAIARDVMSRGPTKEEPSSSTALAIRDPLGVYMAEVRRHPLLTREEEHALAVQWVEHEDKEALRKLVTSNLRLVVKIAYSYKRAYHNLLDLVQEGNVGLLKAVQKFDPYRGVKLSTYSGWWIRAYILKYILNNWRLVKIGTTQNQRKLFFNLRKQREALVAAGIEPTSEKLAEVLEVTAGEVEEMEARMSAPDASLNAPARGDGAEGRTRMEMLPSAESAPDELVDNAEFGGLLQSKLAAFGAGLEGRDLEIFQERLLSEDPITLQDLGTRWGVSRERARQVEKRLLGKLREYLSGELGDAVQIALGGDA